MKCEQCEYVLHGLPLETGGMITCPECGKHQPRRSWSLPRWPSLLRIAAIACGPTAALIFLAFVCRPVFGGVMLLWFLGAMFFGFIMPNIASVFLERVSLIRMQGSPWLLALTVTLGGWLVNATMVVFGLALSR